MIYVPDTAAPVLLHLPRTLAGTPADPALTLTGTADRQTYAVPVTDFAQTPLYYSMRGDFSAVNTPGEYEYLLAGDGQIWARGIIRIGDTPNPGAETYEIAPKYEQYNAE